METMRSVNSPVWGNLGKFYASRTGVYCGRSGRLVVLGEGDLGGKGLGTVALMNTDLSGENRMYSSPRSLVVCNDWFGVKPQSFASPNLFEVAPKDRLDEIYRLMAALNFSPYVAIRSSSLIEDSFLAGQGVERTGAGRFSTDMHVLDLNDDLSRSRFEQKILGVINSAYAPKAMEYWQQCGVTEIPPIALVIQEAIGNRWKHAPGYFFPAVAGMANTAFRRSGYTHLVNGFGMVAVDENQGILFKKRVSREQWGEIVNDETALSGEPNRSAYALDERTSDLVRIEDADALFPPLFKDYLKMSMFPRDAVHLCLAIEKNMKVEAGVDLEFASPDARLLFAVQARPLALRPPVEIPAGIRLFQTDECLGSGIQTYEQILHVRAAHAQIFPIEPILELQKQFPQALVVVSTNVHLPENPDELAKAKRLHQYPGEWLEPLLKVAGGVAVFDRNAHLRLGITHLDLLFRELGKLIVYFSEADQAIVPHDEILAREGFTPIADTRFANDLYTVQMLNAPWPIQLACDDDAGWGLLGFTA